MKRQTDPIATAFLVDADLLRDALRAAIAVYGVLPEGTPEHIARNLCEAAAAGDDPNSWLRRAALAALKQRGAVPNRKPH